MTYTKEVPKKEYPRTTSAPGTFSISEAMGYVTWSSTICGACPA